MQSSLKIGMLTDNYPHSGGAGGIGSYTCVVAEQLARMGHDPHVFTPARVPRLQMRRINDVSVWECPLWGKRREMPFSNALEFSIRYRSDPKLVGRYSLTNAVRRAARDRQFDVIESPDFGALGSLVRPLGCTRRFVVRLHGSAADMAANAGDHWSPENEDTAGECALALEADVLTVTTEPTRRNVSAIWGKPLDRAIVIGNPVNPQGEPRRGPASACTSLTFGRMEKRKGLDILAAAIGKVRKHFPNFVAHFVGQDCAWTNGEPTSAVINRIAAQNGADSGYVISPRLPWPDLVRLAQSSTMCVFPSLAEGFGISVIEAMLWGVPTVLSDLAVFKTLGAHETHCLFAETGNPDDFASKICTLLADDAFAGRIAANAREHAQRYSVERIVPELLSAWLS